MKKLSILVADLDIQITIEALLQRTRALGIQNLANGEDYDIVRHPNHDSGCFQSAHEIMRIYHKTHEYLMVIFDREGSGKEHRKSAAEIETLVEQRLSQNGWENRCCVIIPDPELEAWAWSDSEHVVSELGWTGRRPSLKEWLITKRLLERGKVKPTRPKEAMEAALREARRPKSSSIFGRLAQKVDFAECSDRAFLKMKSTLQLWFGASNEG